MSLPAQAWQAGVFYLGFPSEDTVLFCYTSCMKRRWKVILFAVLVFFSAISFIALYINTGVFQIGKIDERDLNKWQFDEDGVISGAREFTLGGSDNVCWLLIHGYTSTPDEMRGLAEGIHAEFDELVIVPRLKGSGEIPSHIVNLSLDDWHEQVSEEYVKLNNRCEKVNILGFSFGGVLATRLSEENDVNNIYLISPHIFAKYKPYRIFKLETYLDIFSDSLVYVKKNKVGQINSEEGLNKHIAYWNMPLQPIKNSSSFIEDTKKSVGEIDRPILIQQSENDETSDIKSSVYIFENVASEKKEIVIFEKSNHILQEDYDKEEVIENIVKFEKETRL